MLNQNESKCPRCWRKYKLSVNPRPISIKDWEEDEKQITNYKFVCSCGCSWERTKVEDIDTVKRQYY